MQIFVLGMHRSGTSAVTRLINLMGAYVGPEEALTGANAENPKGFWERRDVRDVNDALLKSAGADWWKVANFGIGKIPAEAVYEFNQNASKILNKLEVQRPWVLKEPRLCVLFSLWRRLVENPICILVHRSPVQVARSLQHRNGFPLSFGVALWERYVLDSLSATHGLNRLVVSYKKVMEDPNGQAAFIFRALSSKGVKGLNQPSRHDVEGFISADLFHHRESSAELPHLVNSAQASVADAMVRGTEADLSDLDQLSVQSQATLQLFEDLDSLLSTEKSQWLQPGLITRSDDQTLREREKFLDLAIAGKVDVERLRNALQSSEQSLGKLAHQLETQRRHLDRIEFERQHAEQQIAVLENRLETLLSVEERHDQEKKRRLGLESELGILKGEIAALRSSADTAERQKDRLEKNFEKLILFLKDLKNEMAFFSKVSRWRIGPFEVLPKSGIASLLDRTGDVFREIAIWSRENRADLVILATKSNHDSERTRVSDGPVPPPNTGNQGGATSSVRRRASGQQARRRELTVAVIAWDVGHNPLGRAYMLAAALHRHFNVILLGPSFSRYGFDIWEPVRDADIPTVPIPGARFPEFARTLHTVAPRIQADIIIACKPRLPSIQLGLLMKAALNRPLLVDVDDYELSFFGDRRRLTLNEIRSKQGDSDLRRPYGETWTRFCEELLPLADQIIVSNHVLQRKYGGTIIPHARDEATFDPSLYDREAARRYLGFGQDDRVVLFAGTARQHKGVLVLARAVRELGNPRYHLVVIGKPPDRKLEQQLLKEGGSFLKMIDGLPFENLAETVNAADLVCVPQDPSHEISKSQLPAKIIDALAMGVPVIASSVEPLQPLIRAGAVDTIGGTDLTDPIDRMLQDAPARRVEQLARRDLFVEQFSYQSICSKMLPLIDGSVEAPRPLAKNDLEFITVQDPQNLPAAVGRVGVSEDPNEPIDIVVFWKQNDTGLYGRRHDMFIKYLSRRKEVRQVVVFDHPISFELLQKRARSGGANQWRRVYQETMARTWGLRRSEKITHHTYVFTAGRQNLPRSIWDWPKECDYLGYLEDRLQELEIQSDRAVFWYYPANLAIPEIHRHFQPAFAVTDVVDDHRTWPGISEEKRDKLTAHYRTVLELSDLVLANCETVQKSMSVFRSDIHLIPNACEVEPIPDVSKDPAFRSFDALPRPRIGFAGNLEAKIDVDLLEFLASERPSWQIVLIGSTHMNPSILRLDSYPNVHFIGVVQYPQVRAWIRGFDVAILPHKDTDQTRSMNPLKVFVYLAVGIPVVSTPIANLGQMTPYISIAKGFKTFLSCVENAVISGLSESRPGLERCLRENSWEIRVADVISIFKDRRRCRREI